MNTKVGTGRRRCGRYIIVASENVSSRWEKKKISKVNEWGEPWKAKRVGAVIEVVLLITLISRVGALFKVFMDARR